MVNRILSIVISLCFFLLCQMAPLHVAATNGRYKIVKNLVGEEVTNTKNKSGVSIIIPTHKMIMGNNM